MILVDTSIWVGHLGRHSNEVLQALLEDGKVLGHPFVIGELALGMLKNREEVLGSLETLPQANVATNDEVLSVIESRVLFGRGIGLIDAHLLVAAKLTRDALLWTGDVRLRAASEELGVAFKSSLYV